MKKIEIPESELKRLYVDCFQSTLVIAKQFNCDDETIRSKLKEYGIRRRKGNIRTITTLRITESETNRAYMAGIVDGEGSIIFVRSAKGANNIALKVQVKNTNETLMKWIVTNFGGVYNSYTPLPKHYKLSHCWIVGGTLDMLMILKAIQPYLVIKREECSNGIKYCEEKIARSST